MKIRIKYIILFCIPVLISACVGKYEEIPEINNTFITVNGISISLSDYYKFYWFYNNTDCSLFENDTLKLNSLIAYTILSTEYDPGNLPENISRNYFLKDRYIDFLYNKKLSIKNHDLCKKLNNYGLICISLNSSLIEKRTIKKIIKKEKSVYSIWNEVKNIKGAVLEKHYSPLETLPFNLLKKYSILLKDDILITSDKNTFYIIQLFKKPSFHVPEKMLEFYAKCMISEKETGYKYDVASETDPGDKTEIFSYIKNRLLDRGLDEETVAIINDDTISTDEFKLIVENLPNSVKQLIHSKKNMSKAVYAFVILPVYFGKCIDHINNKEFILMNSSDQNSKLILSETPDYNCRTNEIKNNKIKINYTVLNKLFGKCESDSIFKDHEHSIFKKKFNSLSNEFQLHILHTNSWDLLSDNPDIIHNNKFISDLKFRYYESKLNIKLTFPEEKLPDKKQLNDFINYYLYNDDLYKYGYLDDEIIEEFTRRIYSEYLNYLYMNEQINNTSIQHTDFSVFHLVGSGRIYYDENIRIDLPGNDSDKLNFLRQLNNKKRNRENLLYQINKIEYKIEVNRESLMELNMTEEEFMSYISPFYLNCLFIN